MVTRQDLQTAQAVQIQIADRNEKLRKLIQLVLNINNLDGTGVDLSTDSTMITALQNQYATVKADLASLVASLP